MHARLKTDSLVPAENKASPNRMSSNFQSLALQRYPFDVKMQNEYIRRLQECEVSPAYNVLTQWGQYPCKCYPLMEDDTKGWQVVKSKRRVKRVKTSEELNEEADLDNWDEIEHYGRATYAMAHNYEHNGSLFDIGSRF